MSAEGDGSSSNPLGRRFLKGSASGFPITPSERLPSLKPKRDLTLGGIKKRSFTPTIPARRQKKQSEEAAKNEGNEPVPSTSSKHDGHQKGEGKEKKKEKPGRRKKEVVASASVFSMGPAERMMQSRRDLSTFGRSSSSHVRDSTKSSISVTGDQKLVELSNDVEEPMEVLSSAREDAFLSSAIPPIQLPLDYQLRNKPPRPPQVKSKPVLRVKTEPVSFEDAQMDVDSSSTSDLVNTTKPPVVTTDLVKTPVTSSNQTHVSQLFAPSEDGKGLFLVFQFPDCLPLPNQNEQKGNFKDDESNQGENKKEVVTMPTLRDVPEGLIGKIQVHQSGAIKLVLGETALNVTMGTRGGFLQELASVRTTEPPSITVLGQLSHRLVCVPDLMSEMHDDR